MASERARICGKEKRTVVFPYRKGRSSCRGNRPRHADIGGKEANTDKRSSGGKGGKENLADVPLLTKEKGGVPQSSDMVEKELF